MGLRSAPDPRREASVALPRSRVPRGTRHVHTGRLHPRPVAARHVLAALGRAVPRGGLRTRRRRAGPATPTPSRRPAPNPESIADHGIDDVVEHYAAIIAALPTPADPDRALLRRHDRRRSCSGRTWRPRAVAIDAAQIKGVLPLPLSALRATLPVFKNPANKHRAVSLTAEQFRFAFGNADLRGGVRRAVRAVDDPGAGQAAVRGRRRQLQPALAGQGRHRQRRRAARCC